MSFAPARRSVRALFGLLLVAMAASGCRIITEAMPTSVTPVDTPAPTPTPKKPKPGGTATATATTAATATATVAPTATPAPVPTQSPQTSCPSTAPAASFVNGGNHCARYVPAHAGTCGVDSTWWYDCSDYYFIGATYQYIGGGDPWAYVGSNLNNVACYNPNKNYRVGELAMTCNTGGAITCDADHMVNPAMIACCHNHYWTGDARRVMVTAVDASGTTLQVNRNIGGNPAFSEIVIAHPGQAITVTYCLPPPPLVDADCGTVFPSADAGCSTKTFTP